MSGPMRSSNEDFAGWLDSERMGDSAIVPSGSVVICSRNRPHLLRDCVSSLIAGTAQPTEIIVVDQSQQSDLTLEFLAADHSQSCRVHYHWTPQRGLSRAMNLAVGLAHHNFLLFTHDDVIVDKGWYAAMIAALAEAVSPTIITGRVVASDEPIRGGFVPSLIVDTDSRHYRGRIDNDVLYPMNMAMHRTTFNLVGQFDERLGPGTPIRLLKTTITGSARWNMGSRSSTPRRRGPTSGLEDRYQPTTVALCAWSRRLLCQARSVSRATYASPPRPRSITLPRVDGVLRDTSGPPGRRLCGFRRRACGWRSELAHAVPLTAPGMVSMLTRLIARLRPYQPMIRSREHLDGQYKNGTWDYLWSIGELARFSVVAGYCRFLRPGGAILEIGCGEGVLQDRLDH